jgi:hypothetical protein
VSGQLNALPVLAPGKEPSVLHYYRAQHTISLRVYSPLLALGRTQSVGLLGWGISPSQGLYIHAEQHKESKRTQTSMPRVGCEPTTPVFERAKTVHALERAAAVIGSYATRDQYFPRHCACDFSVPTSTYRDLTRAGKRIIRR